MKENMMDVLMYLLENYMDVDAEVDHDQEILTVKLTEAGFDHAEINKAFSWLEGITVVQGNPTGAPVLAAPSARIYNQKEKEKLDIECRGFLIFLEQIGVLDLQSRELVIDRIMALETGEIEIDTLKWVILMVLFNQPGQESTYAWMENLVFDDVIDQLH